MPRQEVPYGGAICRLKERIAEIWDKLGEKLHSVNGVEGDAAGNVQIVSGDSAVVISNDQVNHQIEIGLDSSQLPSAAVTSVNGETGAVVLTADEIGSDGGSDVQTDIDALKLADTGLNTAIGNETTARANADSTLQTNINAVSASIPEMSVTPDPYKGVERDAQGRAFAANPASGAVDQTLVTANWVSQTGNLSPNNLIHKNGTETINSLKYFTIRPIILSQYPQNSPDNVNHATDGLTVLSSDGVTIARMVIFQLINGTSGIQLVVRNSDGSFKTSNLLFGDVI